MIELGILAALVLGYLLFRRVSGFIAAEPQVLPADAIRLRKTVGGFVEVVGESHYQGNIRRAEGSAEKYGHIRLFWAGLEHEPTNGADPNAVRVHFNGATVGYLPRAEARQFLLTHKAALASGRPIFCEGRVTGGTRDKPHFGIVLDFAIDEEFRLKQGLDGARQPKAQGPKRQPRRKKPTTVDSEGKDA